MSQSHDLPPSIGPPKRGWFARNWLWFVPSLFLAPVLICAGCCGVPFWMLISGLRQAEPYTIALKRVQENPAVVARLGEPIEADTFNFQGNYHSGTGGQNADYNFGVSGPRGSAQVKFVATHHGRWHYETFTVTFPNGQSIDLSDAMQ